MSKVDQFSWFANHSGENNYNLAAPNIFQNSTEISYWFGFSPRFVVYFSLTLYTKGS